MTDRHEQFAGKNAALSRIWSEGKKDRKPRKAQGPKIGKCDQCGEEREIRAFRTQQTDRSDGAASYGISVRYLCEQCRPTPKKRKEENAPDAKAIKAMMRAARKNLH